MSLRGGFLLSAALVLAIAQLSEEIRAGTVTQLDNTGLINTPWESTLSIQRFNSRFDRLDSIDWLAATNIIANASVTNPGSNTGASINASATVSIRRPGGGSIFVNLPTSASGTTFLSAGGTSMLSGSNLTQVTGTLAGADMSPYIGSGSAVFPVSSNAGSLFITSGLIVNSSSLRTSGGIRFTYNFAPIGLSEGDPILPTRIDEEIFYFEGVPSGRWFDPVAADGFRYDMVSEGDSFTNILDFPTGFSAPFLLQVGGAFAGSFGPGDDFVFEPGVRSFTVYGLSPDVDPADPRAFPLQLAFNRDGVTFTMTPVPEPALLYALGAISVLRLPRARRRSVRR